VSGTVSVFPAGCFSGRNVIRARSANRQATVTPRSKRTSVKVCRGSWSFKLHALR
jgi:hypothetical protein